MLQGVAMSRLPQKHEKDDAHYPNRTSDLVITSDTPYHLFDISGNSERKCVWGHNSLGQAGEILLCEKKWLLAGRSVLNNIYLKKIVIRL